MNNALSIVKNPFQGKSKKVLCCCSAGLLRSPTAAEVLREEWQYNTRAAGLEESFALIPVSRPLLHWADEIVVMTSRHAEAAIALLQEEFGDEIPHPPVVCLGIPDEFSFRDPDLKDIIRNSYKQYLDEPKNTD